MQELTSQSLPPSAFGAPARFDHWYPHQWQAIQDALTARERFIGLCVPTGGGKSLMGIMNHLLSGMRTVYVTSTRALQDQVLRDFHMQSRDMRGQQNYVCIMKDGLTVDEGPCHAGWSCPMKDGGCLYYDAQKEAAQASLVITNYSYYMTQAEYGRAIGDFDLLILDEGHLVVDEVTNYLRMPLTPRECRLLEIAWPGQQPHVGAWVNWAREQKPHASEIAASLHPMDSVAANIRSVVKHSREVKSAAEKVKRLAAFIDIDNWTLGAPQDSRGGERVEFIPVWPAIHAERVLYNKAKKVVLMSATLTPKAIELAGAVPSRYFAYPSAYPIKNRRVFYVPTVAMNRRVSASSFEMWVQRINQILRARQDRKTIIHTVSYKRMRDLQTRSTHADHMIVHGSGGTNNAIRQFRQSQPGAVLVSPVVHSGYDFYGDECRCVIIGKVPWPDSTDPLVKARTERDKEWVPHQVMQTVIQMAGRATRDVPDWSEILIIDDDWWWFWWKYKHLAAPWFVESVIKVEYVPQPPNLNGGST